MYVCVRVFMYACMYVCISISANTHACRDMYVCICVIRRNLNNNTLQQVPFFLAYMLPTASWISLEDNPNLQCLPMSAANLTLKLSPAKMDLAPCALPVRLCVCMYI